MLLATQDRRQIFTKGHERFLSLGGKGRG
jgi:hypothetical protein